MANRIYLVGTHGTASINFSVQLIVFANARSGRNGVRLDERLASERGTYGSHESALGFF